MAYGATLQTVENLIAGVCRFRHCLYSEGLLGKVFHSEIVVGGTSRDDESVVVKGLVACGDFLCGNVDLLYVSHMVGDVFHLFDFASERETYVCADKPRRGDLIKKRGEAMEIIAVH
ncbi:hypothetical protein IMSAG025_00633 [Muribaculaceae bacterium]|nr:hypothetical protein IMSAG025_00633 [Muribaculaceae bacterium]